MNREIARKRAKELVAQMTLEEKAALLQGKTVWTTFSFDHANIPEIFLSDGPHGLRKQAGAADHLGLNASVPATCFPTAASTASWSPLVSRPLPLLTARISCSHSLFS